MDKSNAVRRALVKTPAGHMHVRSAGVGDPILLLHWTPASSRQYAHVLGHISAAGRAGYAPDHMGYGQSDRRPSPWAIGDFADNISDLMDGLGLERAAVLGGHLSSEIAVELSLRHPDRVTHLVLDGSPVWDRDVRERVLKVARQTPPPPTESGDHIAAVWQRSLWLQRMWDSRFELDDEGAALVRNAVIDSMLSEPNEDSADALKNYDMADALTKIRVPTLALTAETDPLNNCHENVLSLVQGAVGHTFAGSHPLHVPQKAKMYVDVIMNFLTHRT